MAEVTRLRAECHEQSTQLALVIAQQRGEGLGQQIEAAKLDMFNKRRQLVQLLDTKAAIEEKERLACKLIKKL